MQVLYLNQDVVKQNRLDKKENGVYLVGVQANNS